MKISNSKKQLAKIISENGGWREGAEFSAQDGDGTGSIDFFKSKPRYCAGDKYWRGKYDAADRIEKSDVTIKNYHQTILSRDEYFHLHPAPDADGWIEWNGGECPVERGAIVDIKFRSGATYEMGFGGNEFCWKHDGVGLDIISYRLHKPAKESAKSERTIIETVPTIEQLAADYRNAKDYADRKQQKADAAKADADARLKALELAGEVLGLLVSPITAKKEAELVIEFKVGDEVECVESNIKRDKYNGMVGRLRLIDESDTYTPYLVDFGGNAKIWCHEVKFIHRP